MNEAFKKKWLKALRSGKYRQGRSQLRNENDGFCCIGVACDLLAPSKWKLKDGRYHHGDTHPMGLPLSRLRKLGISQEDAQDLAEMNDAGKRFKTIANYIEKHL